MSQTRRYILFDSSCSLCTDVAADIEHASGGALTGESLYSRRAKGWLDTARPGWKFEPTLVEVQDEQVRAYTGMAMRARMLTILNPLQLLKIARVVQAAGVPLFGSMPEHEPHPEADLLAAAGEAEIDAIATSAEPAPAATPAAVPLGFRMSNEGPEIGAMTPVSELTTTGGERISLAGAAKRNSILLFLSTTCSHCRHVAKYLHDFAENAPEQLILIFSTVEADALVEFLGENRITSLPVAISPETRAAFGVIGIPYAYALDERGIIHGKGIVNNADHLDSLANTLFISVETFKQALALNPRETMEVI